MPAGNVRSIDAYRFSASDRILLDTNVWLFLQGPIPLSQGRNASRYQAAFKKLLTARAKPYLDALVLGEFVNRCARFYFEPHRSKIKFKEFRKTEDYRRRAVDIAQRAKSIVNQSVRIDGRFAQMDVLSQLDVFAKGRSDFSDQLLIDLCRAKKLAFMTDDSDFRGAPFLVLTANPTLLR